MKLIIALIVLSLAGMVVLSACNQPSKKRATKPTTEERTVSGFTSLSIEGVFPVQISQNGNAEFVKIEADEDLQPYIKVINTGDELVIKMEGNTSLDEADRLKVFVNVKDLKTLNYKSVGSLTTTGAIKVDSLEFNAESVGKVKLEVEGNFMRANLNSVGATTLKGKVAEVRINNKSVGLLSAYELKAGTLMIHNTAIGAAEIYADSAFYIRSSAVGLLSYKGPGAVKELNSEGIGKVKKVE